MAGIQKFSDLARAAIRLSETTVNEPIGLLKSLSQRSGNEATAFAKRELISPEGTGPDGTSILPPKPDKKEKQPRLPADIQQRSQNTREMVKEPRDKPIGDAVNEEFAREIALRSPPGEWGSDGTARRPVFIPIIPRHRMQQICGALAHHSRESQQIDVPKLVDQIARRRALRRLPRLSRRSFGRQVIVVRDMTIGMIPFRPDMNRMTEILGFVLRKDLVQAADIDRKGNLPALLFNLPPDSTVLFLSDLQGFARRAGYHHTSSGDWSKLAGVFRRRNIRSFTLAPGAPKSPAAREMRVPKPAFERLFGSRSPASGLGPIIPWDNALSAQRVRGFTAGRVAPDEYDRSFRMPETAHSAFSALLRLTGLVQDLDKFTLRVLRTALRDPALLWRTFDRDLEAHEHIEGVGEFRKNWARFKGLPPVAKNAGPYHEHALWISEYVSARGENAFLESERMSKAVVPANFDPANSNAEPHWSEFIEMVRSALMMTRAGRGLDTLFADAFRWARSPDRTDEAAAGAELHSLTHLGRQLYAADGHDRRVRLIDSSFRPSSMITQSEVDGATPQLTMKVRDFDLEYDVDGSNPTITIPLRPGEDLRDALIEVWSRDGIAKGTKRGAFRSKHLWPLGDTISLRGNNPSDRLTTVILRFPDRFIPIELTASKKAMVPIFKARIDMQSEAFRFDGPDLVVGKTRYDPIGLARRGKASKWVEPKFKPHKRAFRTLGATAWILDDTYLFVQPDPTRPDVSAISLPMRIENDGQQRVARQKGSIAVQSNRGVWHIGVGDEKQNISFWHTDPLAALSNHLAVSTAGVLLQHEHSSGNSNSKALLRLFAIPGDKKAPTAEAVLPETPESIAISDLGLVAVRSKAGFVKVYEPIAALPEGESSAFTAASESRQSHEVEHKPKIEFVAKDTRRWLRTEHVQKESLLEALAGETDYPSSIISQIARANEQDIELRLRSEDIQDGCGFPPDTARLLARVWNEDTPDLNAQSKESANRPFGAHALTPLHLAALMPQPLGRMKALIQLGAEVNVTDKHSCPPLLNACFAEPAAAPVRLLLDNGADPSLYEESNGIRRGVLPVFAYFGELSDPTNMAIFEELLANGADPLHYGNGDKWAIINSAAVQEDHNVFKKLFALDNRVNHIMRSGDSPLYMAAYFGRSDNIKVLLDHGAKVDLLSAFGQSPLSISAHQGHVDSVDILLEAGAQVEAYFANGQRSVPTLEYFMAETSEGTDEIRTRITKSLAKAGANTDVMLENGLNTDIPLFKDLLTKNSSKQRMIAGSFRDAGHLLRLVESVITLLKSDRSSAPKLLPILDVMDVEATGPGGVRLAHVVAAAVSLEEGPDVLRAIAKRSNLYEQDDHGSNPLHYACVAGNEKAIRTLQDLDSNLETTARQDGLTPVNLLILSGHANMAKRLFKGHPSSLPPQFPLRTTKPGSMIVEQLRSLPQETIWTEVREMSNRSYPAGVTKQFPVPLPKELLFWTPVMRREAILPYREKRYLEETFWRRSDRRVGVSSKVLDKSRNRIFQVNGESPPIHEMNSKCPPLLNSSEQARSYLKFFCHSVHAAGGAFFLIESPEALKMHMPEGVDKDQITPFNALSEPMEHKVVTKFKGKKTVANEEHHWIFEEIIRYSTAIFRAKFKVRASGMIDMLEDKLEADWEPDEGKVFVNQDNIFFHDDP